jgi:putative thioredoxin
LEALTLEAARESMETIIGQTAAETDDLVFEATQADFAETVLKPSEETPVIVDFWAPWCGPCKTLMPALEKAVRAAKGAVRLAKVNVDENQALAQQLQIQSIPAVFAFHGGRPVDGFMGAVPESQLAAFVKRVAGAGGPSEVEEILAAAKEALKDGDVQTAAGGFAQVLQAEPDNVEAAAGMARCFLEAGQPEQAQQLIDQLPPEAQEHADVASVKAALALKAKAGEAAGEIAALEEKVAEDPDDHQARVDLASALAALGSRDAAVDQLIESIKRDREWNDELARKELLKLFEAFGPADPATLKGRRKLSSVLFS